jgi:maltose/moltooligosaccharide transporter
MKEKPHLSFWQLWNMSFGYVGIQFGFALQNANMSRIFETLGAKVEEIPILWIAAPVSGLLIQPVIGHLSDKTWNRLGRRKPYFLGGAILSSLALLIMPNSPSLWVAAGMLWMMDGSINVTMQPFRAFIGDMLPDEQRTKGFAVQTFFIGISSVVASALPYMFANWLHIANTAPEGQIPPSVKWSFYLGGVVFLLTVLWTIFSVKEYSPEEQEEFNPPETDAAAKEGSDIALNSRNYYAAGASLLGSGLILSYLVYSLHWDKGLFILTFGIAFYGLLQIAAAIRYSLGKVNGLVEIIYDLQNMPATMKQLALVTVFTWFSLFAMFIYTTSAVTSYHYGTTDAKSDLYNEGANWVGVLWSVWNAMAAIIAFLLPGYDACDLFVDRRAGVSFHDSFQGTQMVAGVYDCVRDCLGKPVDHAVCHLEQRGAPPENGCLYGNVQPVRGDPANSGVSHSGTARSYYISRASHLRHRAGWRGDDFLRRPDDVCQRYKE